MYTIERRTSPICSLYCIVISLISKIFRDDVVHILYVIMNAQASAPAYKLYMWPLCVQSALTEAGNEAENFGFHSPQSAAQKPPTRAPVLIGIAQLSCKGGGGYSGWHFVP
jgi:hypothetical protein